MGPLGERVRPGGVEVDPQLVGQRADQVDHLGRARRSPRPSYGRCRWSARRCCAAAPCGSGAGGRGAARRGRTARRPRSTRSRDSLSTRANSHSTPRVGSWDSANSMGTGSSFHARSTGRALGQGARLGRRLCRGRADDAVHDVPALVLDLHRDGLADQGLAVERRTQLGEVEPRIVEAVAAAVAGGPRAGARSRASEGPVRSGWASASAWAWGPAWAWASEPRWASVPWSASPLPASASWRASW